MTAAMGRTKATFTFEPRTMLDAVPALVAYIDATYTYRFANARYTDWLGLTPEEIVGRRIPDVLGAAAWETVRPHVEVVLSGQRVEFETRVPYASGVLDVRAHYVPDLAPDGTVRGFTGYVQDISAQKRAEAERAAREQELRDFVETSGIGLHWVGVDGTILWANEADYAPLGYTRDEYVGHNIAEFHVDEPRIRDILARLARNERLHQYEARLRAKDGSVHHVLIDSSVRWGPRGEFQHTQCFTQDITERARSAQQLGALRQELARAEKLAALGTLVAGVAHEIRTPLTYLSNNLYLLRRAVDAAAARGDLPPAEAETARGAAGETEAAVARILALVNDLRRYTRDASNEERRPARLDQLAAEAIDLFAATHRTDAEILRDLGPTPHARLDSLRLQQVILNLLTNAVEAGARLVHVRTRVREEALVLEVEDDGPGVPPEAAARIYDPLFTTKPEGSGLGLSIAKKIVTSHRGTIACDSRPGRTVFTVTLPLPGAP